MKKTIIPLLTAATLTAPACAQEAEIPLASLTWQSESTSERGLALEIEDLYLSLYNSGNLVVQKHKLGDRPFAELAMRSEGLFFGSFFPEGIDAMLCDLNRQHCSRNLSQAKVDFSDPTTHVGGYAISKSNWNTNAGDTITLPNYEFQRVTALERVRVAPDWSFEQAALPDDLDCSLWGLTCRELVRELNPPNKHSGAPTAVLPVQQIRTALPLRGDEKSLVAGQLSRSRSIETQEVIFVTPNVLFSDTLRDAGQVQSLSDNAINALKGNLSSIGIVEKFGIDDDPLFEQQIELFKLVQHPFATLETFKDGDLAPVAVAIMDGALNTPHCDLPPLKLPDGSILEPGAVVIGNANGDTTVDDATAPVGFITVSAADLQETPACSEIDEFALDGSEHSASVIGVIASPQNGMGIVGMNPYAEFHFLPFDTDRAPIDQVEIVVNRLQQGLRFSVRVANLSFGVTPLFETGDDFRDVLESRANRTLIVAAAGNHNRDLDRKCPVLPACLNNLSNVITVVGIDSNITEPNIWSDGPGAAGSNTHPRFEIAAPAIGILSTVSGHKFVAKTGTSFAAPQVTAAASLLFARAESFWADDPDVIPQGGQIPPKVVKDRLVYTTDYFASLKGKVFGGRLNVRRALAVEQAQFKLFDREEPVVGLVLEAPQFIQCNQGNAAEQLNFWNVRRMTFDEDQGSHIIFSHVTDTIGDRGGLLERDPSCVIATLSPQVKVRTRVDGNFVEEIFEFRNIKDYTSPMYQR